jgi:hypothetical protein
MSSPYEDFQLEPQQWDGEDEVDCFAVVLEDGSKLYENEYVDSYMRSLDRMMWPL